MALEAAIYKQDLFSHNNGTNNNTNNSIDLYPLLLEPWPDNNFFINDSTFFHPCLKLQDPLHLDYYSTNSSSTHFHDNNPLDFDWHSYNDNNNTIIPSINYDLSHLNNNNNNNYDPDECWGMVYSSSPQEVLKDPNSESGVPMEMRSGPEPRPKQRRRARAKKNQEEIENQRMTHIAVERNRRKQMNEYLNVLRSLMPDSYVQRGDQASIVGAAINYVKELEHNLQNLCAKKQVKEMNSNLQTNSSLPFEDFFTFPQFSSTTSNNNGEINGDDMKSGSHQRRAHDGVQGGGGGGGGGVDVEVTMVESHAHLKIRLRRSLKQLSKLVAGLHSLRLIILHLNVNTADDGVVLYSFSLKVEDETKLGSVDEIAGAVYQLLGRIQEDTTS